MANYVLVGGAWIGGWAWKRVARRLRSQGHDVYAMTLTGLGERVHLARPEVDLDTHIADVVNTITVEDLDDVILVGHSYGGIVVTGVADRVPERLGHLVFLDSAPFADGMSMLDLETPESAQRLEANVASAGDGWMFPVPTFEELGANASLAGLGEPERRLMAEKMTPQPFQTYREPVRLRHAGPVDYRRVLIACNDFRALLASGNPMLAFLKPPEWRIEDLQTGHWPMLSAPDDVASLLHTLANEGGGATR